MHANKREEIKEVYAGDIAAAVGLRDTTTGDTLCDEDHPIVLERSSSRSRSSRIAIEPKTKADQEKLGVRAAEARRRGSVVPRHDRRRDRPDDHLRHGRAAPRDHRRPPGARVQGRRQRRQAAGRLPRDDPQDASSTRASSSGRPAAAASTATSWIDVEPLRAGRRLRVRGRHQGRRRSRASTSRPIEKGIRRRSSAACSPATRWSTSRSTLVDGSLPRRRLVRDRVQDRRLDGVQGRRREGAARHPRADHGASRSSCPRSSWAT